MQKIKLCGMMKKCDIEYANIAKPDFVGFVFANTRRLISYDMAREFKDMLDPDIKAVGVFVDEDVNVVGKLLKDGIIDIAQLHGSEDNDYIASLRAICDKPVIKAIKVKDKEDVINASSFDAEYLLFDTYRKGILGGTGESFNWDVLDYYSSDKPYFLAGGLELDNIKDAASVGSFGLDVSTGIETDGFKDKEKMIEMVRRIRNV